MKSSKKVNMNNIMAGAKRMGLAAAGGYIGVKMTNFIQQQSFMAGYETYSPVATALVGIIGEIMMPKAEDVFIGMGAVALTEMIEKAEAAAVTATTSTTSSTTTTQAQGISRTMGQAAMMVNRNMARKSNTMGFAPQALVAGQSSLRYNGIPAR